MKGKSQRPKREEKGNEIVCNLCEEKFESRRELREHGQMEHENVTHLCVHVYCGNRYRDQNEWKEHMRKEHEIGYHC